MRKLANRMQFGVPEESSLGDGLGEGYGMLGQAGSGKLRVSVAQSNLASKAAKRLKDRNYGSSGGATSGLTSSLAFTPVQGIELSNPQSHGTLLGSGTQSTYFSEIGTCSIRCSKSSRPNLCKRACGTCCGRCSCVPPGTNGNYDSCPCYSALTTHGGVRKCP